MPEYSAIYETAIDRIKSVYNSCSVAEQKLLLQILQEMSDKGYSYTLENCWLADFKEVPVGIDQFLDDPYYLGQTNNNGKNVYPYWRDTFKKIFDAGNRYNEIILSGATRLGKTSSAVTIMSYMLYRLMLYRNPHEYFQKKAISKFTLGFANLTKELAFSVAYREFNDTLKAVPWFCLTGNTNIVTDKGVCPIEDIVGRSDVKVASLNENSVEFVQPEDIVISGYAQELIKLELEDGTIIRGTLSHQIMLADGTYKQLKDLTLLDDIAEVQSEYYVPMRGYEGSYAISNLGNIKNVMEHRPEVDRVVRRPNKKKKGYWSIDLACGGTQKVECIPEMVMKTFYPEYPSHQFYLLDGDRSNNSLSNVRPGRRPLEGEWRDIPGLEGIMQVSSKGEIYCHTYVQQTGMIRKIVPEHCVKYSRDADGYYYVSELLLRNHGYYFVHRIVAIAFLSNPSNLPVVNHIDNNRRNNDVSNLEWVTELDNFLHMYNQGRLKSKNAYIIEEITTGQTFKTVHSAASFFGVSDSVVTSSFNNDKYTSAGLRFIRYENKKH